MRYYKQIFGALMIFGLVLAQDACSQYTCSNCYRDRLLQLLALKYVIYKQQGTLLDSILCKDIVADTFVLLHDYCFDRTGKQLTEISIKKTASHLCNSCTPRKEDMNILENNSKLSIEEYKNLLDEKNKSFSPSPK